jgi:hypothetical protein
VRHVSSCSNYTRSNHVRGIPVPNMYFFVTVSTKALRNRGCDGEPLFARTNPQAGRLAQNLAPGLHPQGSGLFSAAEAKDGKNPTRRPRTQNAPIHRRDRSVSQLVQSRPTSREKAHSALPSLQNAALR